MANQCIVPDCILPAQTFNKSWEYCMTHYSLWRRFGSALATPCKEELTQIKEHGFNYCPHCGEKLK